ncbi:MAG TPA: ATP-dependent helicase, partial [Longimicrobiaceae bacterium]|nr:ATP-dependent helicase [Longimicrobiaceae bacterium]
GKSAEEKEAEMVANEILLRKYQEQGQWGDYAILYRTNLQSRLLEESLRASNIPYRVIGGTSFFDRTEVANAIAYLRIVMNPADEVSLRRIVNFPTRGIGKTTLLRLVEAARARKEPLYETLCNAEKVEGINAAQWEAIRHFVTMIEEERMEYAAVDAGIRAGDPGERTLHTWVKAFVKRLRLEDAIRNDNKNSERATEVRLDIMREFVDSVGRYEERTWSKQPLPDEEDDWDPPSLAQFLERVSLTDDEDKKDDDRDEDPNRATLMTLHSAKGLEFKHVFLVGLEEEILPHGRSVQAVGDALPGAPDPIAEERRLFYVGITRARHRLKLSGCATRRKGADHVPRQPSRFLAEVPPDLLDRKNPGAGSSLNEEESKELKTNFWATMKAMRDAS